MFSGEIDEQAAAIAAQLRESATEPRQQIQRALACCGPERVRGILVETLEIEARGGQLLADDSRRRTPGGVFFGLLRQRVSPDDWRYIRGITVLAAPPATAPLAWAERVASAQAALAEPGVATTARLTVVGRPRDVKAREGFVIVTVDGGDSLPALPRGLPGVEHAVTTYKVCIGEPAWRRVERALDKPGTLLVADGYAVPNSKTASVTVLARFATAKLAQAKTRPGVMRIQLSGRPVKVIHHGPTVLMALTSRRAPPLPDGLPEPPPVTYLVYSVEKQWRSSRAARQPAPAAALGVDGYCFYYADLRCLAVLAQRVTERAEQSRSAPGESG